MHFGMNILGRKLLPISTKVSLIVVGPVFLSPFFKVNDFFRIVKS
jgi:hypothetical protein